MGNKSLLGIGNLSIGDEVKEKIVFKPFSKPNITFANVTESQKKEIVDELEKRIKMIEEDKNDEKERFESIDFYEAYFEKIYKELIKTKIYSENNNEFILFLDELSINKEIEMFNKIEIIDKVKNWNMNNFTQVRNFTLLFQSLISITNNVKIFRNVNFYYEYLAKYDGKNLLNDMRYKYGLIDWPNNSTYDLPVSIALFNFSSTLLNIRTVFLNIWKKQIIKNIISDEDVKIIKSINFKY